ncbi:peptide/nickel transport system substrate-binding protein [Thermotomaculum hydrothermale]|uniref:Peptide/nickel transport system substrate-binding protein n=1 Tax=Thermotomaculum hydrothermale TaxID=981385 RepID=A0A7R6PMF7_9BACT|nr:ABC transporter substrate-binding protein [Thermotomaculum hydrothermale]BBB32258.1 peptide/nickel transport system substrate-binding protein [Thermotomaculum hydrothermale]
MDIVPRLAEKWEINKENTEVTFHLRKGVKFTDGIELTAKDVKYSYDCVFDPKNHMQDIADSMKDIKEVKIIDKYTVKFIFSKPQAFIMDYFIDYYILPEHIYNTSKYTFENNPANKKPIGTGPFKLVKWEKDRQIVLEANNDYFLGRPYLDKIIYINGGNVNIEFERLKKGEFDILPVSISTWKFKTELPEVKNNFAKYRYYLFAFYYIAWNVHKKPLNDRKVRLALAYLSDLERLNKLLFFGLYKVAVSPMHPQSKYFNKNLLPFPYDVERAKQLLNEAGYKDRNGDGFVEDAKGNPLTIVLLTQGLGGIFKKIPVYLQENFKKAGIKLVIDVEEAGIFSKKMSKLDYDGVVYGWSINPTPTYLYSMLAPPVKSAYTLNINRYVNPEILKMLNKLNYAFDENERINFCYRIQDILYKEQPYLFLYYPSALVLVHKRYRNLKPSPLGMFKWYPGMAKVYVPKKLQKRE